MRDILLLARGIDHDEHMISAIGQHQVVQNTARVIGEKPITLPHHAQTQQIGRYQRLYRFGNVSVTARRAQDHLPHMAYIEKPCLRPAMQMLFHHAHGILHRHVIPRERHHLGPSSRCNALSGVISRSAISVLPYPSGPDQVLIAPAPTRRRPKSRAAMPPLSFRLRSLSLRRPATSAGSLQSSFNRAGPFCLRVSGAVAPSALARASSPCPVKAHASIPRASLQARFMQGTAEKIVKSAALSQTSLSSVTSSRCA